jgi:ankyrin repeat protein
MTHDTYPPQDIIDAFVGAAHGDLDTVQSLLSEHPGIVNLSASWGETALGAAAQTAQVEIAELLLAAGAPLDICTAAMLGRQDQVERMLPAEPQGANATGAHNLPLLYHAAIRGQTAIADLLLRRGADPNLGSGHTTALHGTVLFDQPEMARWLLERGADPDALNHDGQTALRLAVDMKRDRVARVLENL